MGDRHTFGICGGMARKLRSAEVDPDRSQVMHLYTRCARGGHLFGEDAASEGVDPEAFKLHLLELLRRLSEAMSFRVYAFALMDNHLHLLLESEPERARGWSAQEVARRWVRLHPSPAAKRDPDTAAAEIASLAGDAERVERTRAKLSSLSQFGKDFKQLAAQEYNRRSRQALGRLKARGGAVFQGRFGLTLPRGAKQWLETMAYIDLNPHAAGMEAGWDQPHASMEAGCPPAGAWTSLESREALEAWERVQATSPRESEEAASAVDADSGDDLPRKRCGVSGGFLPRLRPSDAGAVFASSARHAALRAAGRRREAFAMTDVPRTMAGLFERLTLSAYRRFVAAVSARVRRGKRSEAATPAQRRRAWAEASRELWRVMSPPWEPDLAGGLAAD